MLGHHSDVPGQNPDHLKLNHFSFLRNKEQIELIVLSDKCSSVCHFHYVWTVSVVKFTRALEHFTLHCYPTVLLHITVTNRSTKFCFKFSSSSCHTPLIVHRPARYTHVVTKRDELAYNYDGNLLSPQIRQFYKNSLEVIQL